MKRLWACFVAATLLGASCSGGGQHNPVGVVRIGGFGFAENTMLAYIYGEALDAKGFRTEVLSTTGTRDLLVPALERGMIDLYAGYAASELEFLNSGRGEATADAAATVTRLRSRLKPFGATALEPSPATDANAFAVTRQTAQKFHLSRISDLRTVAGGMVLGGPPECPSRPFCLIGLERTYGLSFKGFRSLDAGGPLSKDALEKGTVDVALVLSSDGAVSARGLVVLDDDRRLQEAENIVPVVRNAVASKRLVGVLNAVSKALITPDLGVLNQRVEDEDPKILAQAWLRTHHLVSD